MPASESDRILAPGIPLNLRGREVTLRYSMRSLKTFEDVFGSISAATQLLNGLIPDRPGEAAPNGKLVSTLVPFLAAGLLHEGITEAALYDGDLLEHDKMMTVYFDAIVQGLEQAFPAPASPGKDGAATPDSNGVASTTPPLDSVAATTPSGA